jgi:hypothetical protein
MAPLPPPYSLLFPNLNHSHTYRRFARNSNYSHAYENPGRESIKFLIQHLPHVGAPIFLIFSLVSCTFLDATMNWAEYLKLRFFGHLR